MLTKEQQKENARQNLNHIGCDKPYREAFESGTITMYEDFDRYYIDDQKLLDKIHEIENTYGGTVYAVIRQITDLEVLYTMLWATPSEEDAAHDVEDLENGIYRVMSYVWNKTYEDRSEFSSVIIKPELGGLILVNKWQIQKLIQRLADLKFEVALLKQQQMADLAKLALLKGGNLAKTE